MLVWLLWRVIAQLTKCRHVVRLKGGALGCLVERHLSLCIAQLPLHGFFAVLLCVTVLPVTIAVVAVVVVVVVVMGQGACPCR